MIGCKKTSFKDIFADVFVNQTRFFFYIRVTSESTQLTIGGKTVFEFSCQSGVNIQTFGCEIIFKNFCLKTISLIDFYLYTSL